MADYYPEIDYLGEAIELESEVSFLICEVNINSSSIKLKLYIYRIH